MNKFSTLMIGALAATAGFGAQAEENIIPIFEYAVFYDGYDSNNPDADKQDGILRHRTSLYAKRLSDDVLSQIGDQLTMNIYIGALCDDYDRIGNINLAFVPKGAVTYKTDEVDRIEIGRFITPFMNKNKQPNEVPYTYDISYVSEILRDATLREEFDIWLEFELFGIPYSANQKIAGCAGRTDVFTGTLDLVTNDPAPLTTNNVLVPIRIKNPEYIGHNLNNYQEDATDELGKTIKTYTFEVPEDVEDGQLVLITSNHGANQNGEEYNRRWHYVYFDDLTSMVLVYKPGRDSCEPFRQYNTMGNGIYQSTPQSNGYWQSFSNWCPGDVIDNRIIKLGAVSKGTHSMTISVPHAKFNDQQGDFPLSLYFQGAKTGTINSAVTEIEAGEPMVRVVKNGDSVSVESESDVWSVELYDVAGKLQAKKKGAQTISTSGLSKGVYLLHVQLTEGMEEVHRLILP